MTQEQESYIANLRNWIKGQQITVKMCEQSIIHSKNMIKLHTKNIESENDRLFHENKITIESIKSFNDWCELNDLKEHKITIESIKSFNDWCELNDLKEHKII